MTNGQSYYYKVTAVNAIGVGANATEVSGTPASVPNAPRNLTATPGNTQIVLNWLSPASDGGSPVTSYWIYRWTASSYPKAIILPGNMTMYHDTGLMNGVTYFYKIAAENSIGTSANSTIVNATPSAVLPHRYPILVLDIIVIGMSLGVAIPVSYNRYKQRLLHKKPVMVEVSAQPRSTASVDEKKLLESDKRARRYAR